MNRANAFLNSIFTSLLSGAVVLNRNFDILVWNRRAEDLWGLRPDEVQGRSLFSLDIGLPVGELRGTLRACLTDGEAQSELTVDALNRRGKKIRCRVACTPLVSGAERQGVIVLMDEVE